MIKTIKQISFLLTFSLFLVSWGGVGHKTINYKSPESFPASMNAFKVWATQLESHGSDADYRKSDDKNEAPRHYIDIDNYSEFNSTGSIALSYESNVNIHGSNFVIRNGILPWATLTTYNSLVAAFRQHEWNTAMLMAADLGHYVGDGHMPLHITENYDGGSTGQNGIHSRYESTMVGKYSSSLDNYSGSEAHLVSNVNAYILNYIYTNHAYVDSVLLADTYAYNLAGDRESNQYYTALWSKTRFTTTLFKNASHSLAELIYTAWVEAGNPAFGTTSSIVNPSQSSFSLYPNPTNGLINLTGEDILKAEIRNIAGISLGTFNENKMDISNLPNGIYFISIYGKNGFMKKEKVLLSK